MTSIFQAECARHVLWFVDVDHPITLSLHSPIPAILAVPRAHLLLYRDHCTLPTFVVFSRPQN